MKKIILSILLLMMSTVHGFSQSKISFELNGGIGYDLQTRSNNYNLTGPLVIPSQIKSSILHIEKPYQVSLEIAYKFNKNIAFLTSFAQNRRALRYWSIDGSYRNDKIDLKIVHYNIDVGLRFETDLESKLNLFWDQTFGVGFGNSSPIYSLNKEHKQAELIYLHDGTEAALVHVLFSTPIISVSSNVGIEYSLMRKLKLVVGVKFVNELSNGNDLRIYAYDIVNDQRNGAYTPYDMEFKSIFSEIGLRFKL